MGLYALLPFPRKMQRGSGAIKRGRALLGALCRAEKEKKENRPLSFSRAEKNLRGISPSKSTIVWDLFHALVSRARFTRSSRPSRADVPNNGAMYFAAPFAFLQLRENEEGGGWRTFPWKSQDQIKYDTTGKTVRAFSLTKTRVCPTRASAWPFRRPGFRKVNCGRDVASSMNI